MSLPTIVAKFGGTSVADYDSMLNCYRIISSNEDVRVVVLSASAGITNILVELSQGCDKVKRTELLNKVREVQFNIINRFKNPEPIAKKIDSCLNHITSLSEAASLATNDALAAAIIAHGELMSTMIFTHLCNEEGCPASWFDARQVIKTDSVFCEAAVDIERTLEYQDEIIDVINKNVKVITQGFIGQEANGKTTTLGRGGSDYSAALFAEVVGAKEVHIWTDVAGIYTTDPRIVPNAVRIDNISFKEASEMAVFGAKVLHPATILPAVRANIPVFIGNSKEPNNGGTLITKEVENPPSFRGIACKRNQTICTVTSLKMLGASGFLARVFDTFAKHNVVIDCVTTSEVSVAVTVDHNQNSRHKVFTDELLQELRTLGKVKLEDNLTLIALIGNCLQTSTGVASTLQCLDKLKIRMICQGASDNNLCILVSSDDANNTIRRLHAKLFEGQFESEEKA